jgi:FG-GAP-like repeat
MKTTISTRAGGARFAVRAWRQGLFARGLFAIVANVITAAVVIGTTICALEPAAAQFTQQGAKLIGTGAVGSVVDQANSVAVSADGNTVIMGGSADSSQFGAAWVFTRSNGVWVQQGTKLVGSGAVGTEVFQGAAVALSADGNTAIVGGPGDSSGVGAAWVFTRSNGVWTQQGNKLTGSGAIAQPGQGLSVALSGDGNTAIIGGPGDNSAVGAAWVFTRTNGVWSQQGDKLTGTGGVDSSQGFSVALSADGNTAVVGGPNDNGYAGATWVFARSNGIWTQQGGKLTGTGAVWSEIYQGWSVAVSADGNTAVVGGPGDNAFVGAAWVFTRSNGVWAQQGSKLTGSGAIGGDNTTGSGAITGPEQGSSVALSADGNTVMMGGIGDDSFIGAAWVFTRSNGVWTQQGNKLIGSGAVGQSEQGNSVALSADGNTAIIGGDLDNSTFGAAWVFVAPARPLRTNTHDFNGDGASDIAWRDDLGDTAIWLMNGAVILSSGGVGTVPNSWSIAAQRDFDGDGKTDLLWRDTLGNTAIWFMNGAQVGSASSVGNISTGWSVLGAGDFNGDGLGDILWQDSSGNLAAWLMAGASLLSAGGIGNVPAAWSIAGTGDFDGDGKTDLLWRDTLGDTAIWFMNGVQVASSASVGNIATTWSVVGTGDFNGDGMSDIVWRDALGNMAIWLMNGAIVSSAGGLGNVPSTWSVADTGDYDGDGKSDLLWRDTSGDSAIWFMNGVAVSSTGSVGNVATTWTVQSANTE